jgi:hypothetical protein
MQHRDVELERSKHGCDGGARSRGLNVEAELAGSNSWNADSSDPWYGFGATNASPLDWVVWGDIATKMMQHFLADQIEVFPEPDTPNEGTTRYNTYYEHAQSTIRAVSATVPIGGPGTYVDGGTYVTGIHNDTNIPASSINFISVHTLSGSFNPSSNDTTNYNLAQSYWPGISVFDTNWNVEGSCTNPADYNSSDSVAGVGLMLTGMLNLGLRSAKYYTFSDYLVSGSLNGCSVWTAAGATTFIPKAYTWFLLSKQLGLGAGNGSVKATTTIGLSAAVGATNSAGKPVVVLVNDSAAPVAGSLTLNGLSLSGSTSFQAYLADDVSNNAVSPVSSGNVNVSGGVASLSFSMTPFSVEGLVLGASVEPTPTPTSSPSATPTPSGSPAKTCAVTESSPAANAVMSGSAYPITLSIACDGKYDHARWSMGPKGGSGETGHVNLSYNINNGTLDTTTQANGPTQSAVAIFLDAAETQRVQGSVAPNYGWNVSQNESINNVATRTPAPTPPPTPAPTPPPTPAPTPAPGCTNIGFTSPAAGSTVASPVTFSSNFTGCSGWPGASGFMRVEQTAPYPIHYDGAAGSPITVATLAPGTYTVNPTFWSNSVTPVGGSGASITFTVGVPPTPTPIPTPPPTPVPTPTHAPTPTPAPTPTSCQPSLSAPAQLSTVGSPVTFMVSALGCGNWPGASGFLRIEQTSPYPIHSDGNPGSRTTIVPLAAGAYRAFATLWLNSVTQIGPASPQVNFTVGTVPNPTATPSPTPSSTPTPSA